MWSNYKTDYKPLVEFARDSGLYFVASNVPRRYASVVHKKGFEALDSLSDEAKNFLPPLPILYDPEVKSYKDMMEMMEMSGHVNENFPKAQAIKDATMAHFILKNWEQGKLMFHFNGAYHSQYHEGIIWYINQLNPGLNIQTISVVQQEDISELAEENLEVADYIVCIPSTMTRTNRP